MLAGAVEYWWDNARQSLETSGATIIFKNFKKEFLEKYFPEDVCIRIERA